MNENRKVVRVFLASPGDLEEERKAAKSVVDEINSTWAKSLGYHVELVGWEETLSGVGRPQEIINRDLATCELFIGIMWRRWGTATGSCSSGFQEEFSISLNSHEQTGRPEIALYFKTVDQQFLTDPGSDLKRVQEFKARIERDRKILYESFVEGRDFERRLNRKIYQYVSELKANEEAEVADRSQSSPATSEIGVVTSVNATPKALSDDAISFGQRFLRRVNESESDLIDKVEVARFRLLGATVGASGNDSHRLGVHDSNILYANRLSVQLGPQERAALIEAGLENFGSENTPMWHWYAVHGGFGEPLLHLWTAFGEPSVRAGALMAMRLISEPVLSRPSRSREAFVRSWFKSEGPAEVRVAALRYLAECGVVDDLPIIGEELARGNYQTTNLAVEATLRINLRESREKALLALYDLQLENVGPNLIEMMFGEPVSISTDLLVVGLAHRSSDVRRMAAAALRKRGALDKTLAQRLLSDSEPDVAFEGLAALEESAQGLPPEEAKAILTRPTKSALSGLLSIGSDRISKERWEKFTEVRLRNLKIADLKRLVENSTIYDRPSHTMLFERDFKKRRVELQLAVDDHFKRYVTKHLEILRSRFPATDLGKIEPLVEEHLGRELTREALDIICRNGDASDLALVRKVMKSNFIPYSAAVFDYLKKFGEWDDLLAILASLIQRTASLSLFGDTDAEYDLAAERALYGIGRKRLVDLVKLEIPRDILANVIVAIPDSKFRELGSDVILDLLHSDSDRLRKAVALKSVRAFSRAELGKLLDKYMSSEVRTFYNVIYWLDYGVSVPSAKARNAVNNLLAQRNFLAAGPMTYL